MISFKIFIASFLFGVAYEFIFLKDLLKNYENVILKLFGTKEDGLNSHNTLTKLLTCPYCLSGQLSLWLSIIFYTGIIEIIFTTLATILSVKIFLDLWRN